MAVAWTSGQRVAGVVKEMHGTDAELVEVKAGADTAEGGPSAWRHSRGEEDSTRGAAVTWRGTPDHSSMRRHSGTLRDSTVTRWVVRGKQLQGHDARAQRGLIQHKDGKYGDGSGPQL
jgi:hypothetical protein